MHAGDIDESPHIGRSDQVGDDALLGLRELPQKTARLSRRRVAALDLADGGRVIDEVRVAIAIDILEFPPCNRLFSKINRGKIAPPAELPLRRKALVVVGSGIAFDCQYPARRARRILFPLPALVVETVMGCTGHGQWQVVWVPRQNSSKCKSRVLQMLFDRSRRNLSTNPNDAIGVCRVGSI